MQRKSFVRSTRNWWRGLLPLAAIWIATNATLTETIESDLASRAMAEHVASNAKGATTPWAFVRVAGRDVNVEGTSPGATARTQTVSVVDNVWGVRLVDDQASDLIAVVPFTWGAERDGSQLVLTGYVPPGGTRAVVLKDAEQLFPGLKVADNMEEGGGAPPAFALMTANALTHLSSLTTGQVALIDTSLSIRGAAATSAIRDRIVAAARDLPAPMTLLTADITAPAAPALIETSSIAKPTANYVWLARSQDKRLTLSGFVPDEASRKAILASAGRNFTGATLDDKLKVTAEGVPDGFTSAVEVGLTQLARLETGSATITDKQLTLVGLAESEEIAGQTRAEVGKVSAGFAGDATIVARPKPVQVAVAAPAAVAAAPDCVSELKSAGTKSRIQFQSLRAVILPDSMPVIDGIASILKRCPALKIEVTGHTDSTGRPDFNKGLSLRRAAAVVATLAKAGVERPRLKSAGFGEARPVEQNATAQGRAANRRIEFTVVP
jgi:OmpA-OmpF porin, OOP family